MLLTILEKAAILLVSFIACFVFGGLVVRYLAPKGPHRCYFRRLTADDDGEWELQACQCGETRLRPLAKKAVVEVQQ